jgi:alpha-L-rhamnosidase
MTFEPQGSFISSSSASNAGDPAVYFRREFDVDDRLHRATLRITALGIVAPYLNGVRVGDEVLAPGWTSYRHRLMVSSYDVTDQLVTGHNALGAIVGEGWAVGDLTWEKKRHNYADRPALFAQLELEYADRTEIIATDGQFRVGEGAVRGNGIYAGETYDARLEPDGWHQAGFDDSGWASAQLFDCSLETLELPTAPPIRRIEDIAPIDILTSPQGTTIVDFGQIVSGWVRLTVSGEAGSTVTLRYAEVLTPDGGLETETNRGAETTDRYTLRGGAQETWEPGFTFHGFRYVEVTGWPGSPDKDAFTAVVVHSDMPRTGWFETSNELVNQLHKNVVWSMRGNFVGVPTDCPQRDERLGWAGDLNVFAPTATFLYDVRGVLGSWLQDLAVEQEETGSVPWVVPYVAANMVPVPSTPTAVWSDVAVSLPWALYQEYGDLDILRRSYGSMTAFIRQVEPLLNVNGLWDTGFQFGDWLDPDAPADRPWDGKTDNHLIAAAYLCKTTREMAETSGLLGEKEDAARFRALHEKVRGAFRDEYVSRNGRVTNESATAYALVIMFGILDEDQRRKAGDRLAEIVEKADFTISTGFAGTHVLTHALSSTGHLEQAYKLLLNTAPPSFLYPVTMGATTMWERWDSLLPDGTVHATGMTSLNHYALGAIGDWLQCVVGGLNQIEAGWTRIQIAPKPGGGIMSAKAAHETPNGRVEASWRVEDNEMVLDINVPPGTTAAVILPLHPDNAELEVGPGPHSWRYTLSEKYGAPIEYTMDTVLGEIFTNAEVWAAVLDVFRVHLPGVPLDAAATHLAAMPLSAVVERAPDTKELERDLRDVLSRANA